MKRRIIAAMGGKCVCCEYDQYSGSLALHHLDPDEKDFGFGSMRKSARSWAKIVVELRKCVLVCHNCHSEIHGGVRKVPKNAARFNEAWTDYSILERPPVPCRRCKRPTKNGTCTKACAILAMTKANWPPDEDLRREVWGTSMRAVGLRLGVSDKAVKKRCVRLGIEVRPVGWTGPFH